MRRRVTCVTCALVGLLLSAAWLAPARGQEPLWSLFVMKPDGSAVRQLPQVPGYTKHNMPRWSHDGKRVMFDVSSGTRASHALYVVNADGTELKQIGANSHGDWSPDDKQFVCEFYTGKNTTDICVQNVDGSERTTIAAGTSPRWSPDASLLAYEDQGNVMIADLLSGESRPLLKNPVAELFSGFAWFPGGRQLAFVVRRERAKGKRELLFVNVEGEQHGLRVRLRNEMGGGFSISPDGKQLVFSDNFKLHIVDVEGGNDPRLVPNQRGFARHPDWSPDGNWIVFASDRATP